MRLKVLLLSAAGVFLGTLNAQVLLSQDFTGYDGSKSSVPAGWYFSWNSSSSPSCYNSSGYSGLSIPAYKFGIDQDTIISPPFGPSDSLSFWVKGSSTFSVLNTLEVYGSADSSSWNLIEGIDSLPQSEQVFKLGISSTLTHLKFVYVKYTGNLAFDDIMIYKNLLTGFNPIRNNNPGISIFPNPTSGIVNIELDNINQSSLQLHNLFGEVIFQQDINAKKTRLDLSGFPHGIYFLLIRSASGMTLKKIVLTP